jgi:CheY-like chemotaxis protein/tetratricopeptide (TPR) repeat protein
LPATILCADDDRNLCQILSRALVSEGYSVRTAHDGEEALAALRAAPPDLLLLDLLLPKRDGFGVLEELRRGGGDAARVPVVLVSGCSGTTQYAERARSLGARTFLTKPVPLDTLTGVIQKILGAAIAPPQKRVVAASPSPRLPLSGSLEKVPFAALLHHLHGLRASGVLRLHSGRKRKALQIRDGRPVAVRSNLVNECLGNLLVRTGRIDKRAMDESLARMRRGEGLQGQILLAMRLVDADELAAALRIQAEEKLFEIFSWTSGSFDFKKNARLVRANTLALTDSPANVILRGLRGRMPIAGVNAALEAHGDGFVGPGESPFYRFQEIDLDARGTALLEELDGTRRLSEFLGRDEATRRTLYGLLTTGLISVRARSERPCASERAVRAPRIEPTREAEEQGIGAELAAMAERLRGRDYFAILGVGERASTDEIREAYRDAAKRTHPDRFRGASDTVKRLAEEVFGLISVAYEAIVDPKRRASYVRQRAEGSREAAELEQARQALQAELRFSEGERFLRRRDYLAALGCFEEAVRIYPEEGEYHTHRGWALFLARPSDPEAVREALGHLRRGRKLAPDSEKSYLFLGRLYRAVNRSALAEKCFTRAVQINPDCVEALRELRLIDMRRQKAKGLIGRWLRR